MSHDNSHAIAPQSQSIFERLSILDIYEIVMALPARTNTFGDNYMVRCPVVEHEDHNPSCSISDSKSAFNCFGCGAQGGKYKLCIVAGKATDKSSAARFLEAHANLPRTYMGIQPIVTHAFGTGVQLLNARTTGIYPYNDENGKLLYRVKRQDGDPIEPDGRTKTFTMEFPQPDGTYTKLPKPHNMRRVPYNLPALVANEASEHPRSVLVWEGEGKADVAMAMGFLSTTNANGSSFRWKLDWLRFFQRAPYVFVLCDSDKIGRAAAQTRATLLTRADRPAFVIDFFPERDNGDDFKQWRAELFELGFTEEQIAAELRHKLRTVVRNYNLALQMNIV